LIILIVIGVFIITIIITFKKLRDRIMSFDKDSILFRSFPKDLAHTAARASFDETHRIKANRLTQRSTKALNELLNVEHDEQATIAMFRFAPKHQTPLGCFYGIDAVPYTCRPQWQIDDKLEHQLTTLEHASNRSETRKFRDLWRRHVYQQPIDVASLLRVLNQLCDVVVLSGDVDVSLTSSAALELSKTRANAEFALGLYVERLPRHRLRHHNESSSSCVASNDNDDNDDDLLENQLKHLKSLNISIVRLRKPLHK
jgi:hypothetical protein